MSYEYHGVTEEELVGKGNVGRPDTPNVTTTEMQVIMDELSNIAITHINSLVAELNEHAGNAVESSQITNIRFYENELQFSLDNGVSWNNTGTIIEVSASPDAIKMDNYTIAEAIANILQTDTLNQAIGKLEKRIIVNQQTFDDSKAIHDFPIGTTWEANADIGDYVNYPFKQVIETEVFTMASQTGYVAPDHELLAGTPENWLTEAEIEDIGKIAFQVDVSATGITLLAKEATTNALTIRFRGLGQIQEV